MLPSKGRWVHGTLTQGSDRRCRRIERHRHKRGHDRCLRRQRRPGRRTSRRPRFLIAPSNLPFPKIETRLRQRVFGAKVPPRFPTAPPAAEQPPPVPLLRRSRHSGLGMVVPSFGRACYQAREGGFTECLRIIPLLRDEGRLD
jgi:hypothetical protein